MTKPTTNPLRSTDTLALTIELSNQQIAIIQANDDLGGKVIAEKLLGLRNAIWGDGKTKKPASDDLQKSAFDSAISDLNSAQKEQLISSYARMGHMYDIAALSARSNYIEEVKKDPRKTAPGGIEELVKENGNKTVDHLVEKLNKPVFEVVMTAHPTNVNSLESMKAQREIDKALENRNQEELTKALTDYQRTPLLHQVEKNGVKQDANLTVHDETKTALYFLGNLYEDLPKAYKNYDDALSKYADKKNSSYDPTTLNLKTKFGSWASSGDKDGNNNVTAESTLEAIAMHTQEILKRYSKDLAEIKSPELAKWKDSFDTAVTNLNPLIEGIEQLRKDSKNTDTPPIEINGRFDKLSKELAKIRNGLDKENFEKDLKVAAATDKDALNLLRRERTFGFNFAKIEYRETAKEYDRVVGEVVGEVIVNNRKMEFKDLSPEQKVEKLTEILSKPENIAAKLFANKRDNIISEGAGKAYSDDSAKPIAYHTLKRMALARDFGDVIKDNVLAECGQLAFPDDKKRKPTERETVAQGVANILEAQLLQKAVEKNGKRPTVGIVPLFEEPDTMAHIDKIMGAVYENEAYKKQMKVVQEANGTEKPTQQVMIAHSDNARRSGLQAARAYIHEAHQKIRALNKERKESGKQDIQTQFFEGGSVSDAYRNGVRAISASVNAFDLHDFAKFTFQGGDLLNYFNHPDSTARLINRQISHQAKSLEKNTSGEWITKARDLNGRTPDLKVEKNVVDALKKTLDDYQKNDFTENTMGVLLAALNYNKTVQDSNAGSRAGARGPAFAAGSTTAIGSATVGEQIGEKTTFKPIPIDKVRTIGFSKAWQGSGIVPSWIGALDLKGHLDDVNKLNKYKIDLTTLQDGELKPSHLNIIYEKSPTFRDAQDRSAFALALTDMDSASAIANQKLKINTDDTGKEKAYKTSGASYLERVQKTYRAAAELSYSAHTGKALNSSNFTNRQIRDKMVDALPLLKDDIINKTNYRAFLLHLQIEHPEILADAHMGRTAQAAKDTVEHGRWLAASDPTLAHHKAQGNGRAH